jgi:formylglycine-generating enzyme required for sulfatase activity
MKRSDLLQTFLAAILLSLIHITAASAQSLKPGSSFRDCSNCPEMVVVPAGHAVLGSSPEDRARFDIPKPFTDREVKQIDVRIAKPFAVAKYEVTRGMWAQYVHDARVKTEPGCAGFDVKTGQWPFNPALSWQDPGFKQGDNEPVVCLNWPDAKGFVSWLAKKTGKPYRLLSETEWEYAARGGATTTYPWGDSADVICDQANIYDKATAAMQGNLPAVIENVCVKPRVKTFTEPVGSYPPNGFGLYDMVGNAWELVEDCATDTYAALPTDGSAFEKAGCKTRVPRGGGWNSQAWTARLATRGQGAESYRAVALGMRVARDLP